MLRSIRADEANINKMAALDVEDNDLPDEIITSLEDFYRSMNTVEETLDPLFAVSSEDLHEKVCRTMKSISELL